jgi:hypothetical protein
MPSFVAAWKKIFSLTAAIASNQRYLNLNGLLGAPQTLNQK